MYFLLFAGALMLLVWFLQIFFLNTYYEDMKIDQAKETAVSVASSYHSGNTETLVYNAAKASDGDDIYIRIDKGKNTIFPTDAIITYQQELSEVQPMVEENMDSDDMSENAVSKTVTNPDTQKNLLSTACGWTKINVL